MDLETESPLRTTDDPVVMREWAVALNSEGIPFRIEVDGASATLVTSVDDAERAAEVLADFDEDRPEPPRIPVPAYGRNWAGAIAAWLLLAVFFVTGSPSPGEPWFERGVARADAILSGEIWRTISALCLHADLAHALSNAAATFVLLTAVAWRIGPGAGSFLVLLSGAIGNAMVALTVREGRSLGASTADFGALGVLTALQIMDVRRGMGRRRASWVIAAASLGLLGFLGSSAESDVLAHVSGWFAGLLLGALFALIWRDPPRRSVQLALFAATTGLLASAWALALTV